MELLQITIVGVIASGIMEFIKSKFDPSSMQSKASIVGISIVLGTIYWFIKDTSLYIAVLGILGVASTVYAFFIKKSV